jgi:hypothetical protein
MTLKTKNYEIFKFKTNNRDVKHYKRIVESIKKIGYIDAFPILVNSNFEILDGQNRFYACRELGLEIAYSIYDNMDKSDEVMIQLNKSAEVWRLESYIKHYAENGNRIYESIRDFDNQYKLGISNTLSICVPNSKPKKIKAGILSDLNPKRNDIAVDLKTTFSFLKFNLTNKFVEAIVELYAKADKKAIKKIHDNVLIIKQQANTSDYLLMFENMINKRTSVSNRVSLQNK